MNETLKWTAALTKGWPGLRALGIGTRLTLAFGALAGVTFLVVALAWIAGRRATDDIDLSELVRRPASLASAQAQANLLQMRLHVRGYLLLGEPADIEQYRAARRSFEADLAALQSTSWPEVEDAQAVRAVVDGYREWAELPQQLFDLHDSVLKTRPALGLAREDLQLYRTKVIPQADALARRLADLTARQQAQLGSSLAHARMSLATMRLAAVAAGVLAVAFAAAMAYAFRRGVVVPLHRLTRVAERVTAGDLAARAEVEASDEVGVLASGINTMTERLSETIRHLETTFAEAQEAKAAAEVANRAKSRFLASMSHELRTPLNAVLGYAQILQSEPGLSEFQSSRLEKIRSGGERLLAMINDVLDLSRMEAGKVDLQPQPMNLPGLLNAVCSVIRAAADRKGLSFACELAPDLPTAVSVDGRRLEQVLLNLLGNAVKFTEHGQASLRVRRLEAAGPGEARVRFEVADSGIGIAPEQLATLFRPFEEASDAKRQHGGSGLGLAISQRIVAMMGGHIEVDSQPGEGSVFRFEIAVALAEADAAPEVARGGAAQDTVWRRVLVIGPESARRAELAESLAACGFELAYADGAASALEQARVQGFDLVLVDIGMPDARGPEAIRRLRGDPSLRELPVIALSETAAAQELASSGADALLRVPVDVAALAATIGDLRQRRRQGVDPSRTGGGLTQQVPALVVPGGEELELLYELARIGNMRSIGERADHLARLDPGYQPFARRLRDLAQRFQSRAILDWISELRRSGTGDVTKSVRGPTVGL